MATIDVEVQTTIARPRAVVAAYCCDPDNATSWYANTDSVRWETPNRWRSARGSLSVPGSSAGR